MSNSIANKWYNKFSKVYDQTNDYPYRATRQEGIEWLGIEEGDIVLDLFCGTGVNFAPILPRIGKSGKLIAIDGSAGMLDKARLQVEKNEWEEYNIQLIQKDLQSITPDFLAELLPANAPLKVLMMLGPVGMSGWELFWENMIDVLPPNTPLVMMDVHCRKGSFSGAVINFLGAGDFRLDISSYKPWQQLEARCTNFEKREYYPFRLLNCSLVLSTGKIK